jgi:hypothetical protein
MAEFGASGVGMGSSPPVVGNGEAVGMGVGVGIGGEVSRVIELLKVAVKPALFLTWQ